MRGRPEEWGRGGKGQGEIQFLLPKPSEPLPSIRRRASPLTESKSMFVQSANPVVSKGAPTLCIRESFDSRPSVVNPFFFPVPTLFDSLYVTGTAVIGLTLAGVGGGTNVNDPGVLQSLYLVLLPAALFAIIAIAEFWVESLPTQVTMNCHFAVLLCALQCSLFVAGKWYRSRTT